MRYKIIIFLIMAMIVSGTIIQAELVPHTINYQGWLTDNSPQQQPVDGTASMLFSIYDAETAGNQLWQENWPSVYVSRGIFNIVLGSNGNPIPALVFNGGTARYLEVQINGQALNPRQQISAVAYAHKSETTHTAGTLAGMPPSAWQRALSSSSCPADQYLHEITQDGTQYCGTPASNAYYPGSGLYLTGDHEFNMIFGATAGTAIEGNDAKISDWILSGNNLYSGNTGNTGIGTNAPQAKLDISGKIRIVDGSQGSGKILTSDSAGTATWQVLPTPDLPSGAVMFFNSVNCPAGWSELINARGRYLVGLPVSGALGAMIGSPLSDQENRPAGIHSHPISDPGHRHAYFSMGGLNPGYHSQTASLAINGTAYPTATTGIILNDAGTIEGTNAPYIELLICQKD